MKDNELKLKQNATDSAARRVRRSVMHNALEWD